MKKFTRSLIVAALCIAFCSPPAPARGNPAAVGRVFIALMEFLNFEAIVAMSNKKLSEYATKQIGKFLGKKIEELAWAEIGPVVADFACQQVDSIKGIVAVSWHGPLDTLKSQIKPGMTVKNYQDSIAHAITSLQLAMKTQEAAVDTLEKNFAILRADLDSVRPELKKLRDDVEYTRMAQEAMDAQLSLMRTQIDDLLRWKNETEQTRKKIMQSTFWRVKSELDPDPRRNMLNVRTGPGACYRPVIGLRAGLQGVKIVGEPNMNTQANHEDVWVPIEVTLASSEPPNMLQELIGLGFYNNRGSGTETWCGWVNYGFLEPDTPESSTSENNP